MKHRILSLLMLAFTAIAYTQPSVDAGNDRFICPGQSVQLVPTVTGGTPPYTYQWSPAGSLSNPFIANPFTSAALSTTYSITVTDNNGLTAFDTVRLNIMDSLNIQATINNVSCHGGSDGSIFLTVTGGYGGPYGYAWSDVDGVATNTHLTPGIYSVWVSSGGCMKGASFTISEPLPLAVSFNSVVNATCGVADGSACVTPTGGTAPYAYNWSGGMTTSCPANLQAGVHIITVTDPNGCTATGNVLINSANSTLSIAVDSVVNVACHGFGTGGIYINATGGTAPYSYLWSNGSSTEDMVGITIGTYTVSVTDNAGCLALDTFTITQPLDMDITYTKVNPVCHGESSGSIDITVTGGVPPYTYSWGNNVITTEDLVNVPAGFGYYVFAYDANGCSVSSGLISLSQPGGPIALLFNNIIDATCGVNDGNACVVPSNGTGPYAFTWSSGSLTSCAANLSAGTYTVTVTDVKGCTAIDTLIVSSFGSASYSLSYTLTPVDCITGTKGAIDISVTGGAPPYTYLWSNGATTQDISNLIFSNYVVTITDNTGCSDSTHIMLTKTGFLDVAITSLTPAPCGDTGGSVCVNASGGAGGYIYTWNMFGGNSPCLSNTSSGNKMITVRDSIFCWGQLNLSVPSSGSTTVVTVDSVTPVACNNPNSGAIHISVSGGTPPYTYKWFNVYTTQDITGVSAGPYHLTVTDANICLTRDTIVVPQSSINVTIVNAGDGLLPDTLQADHTGGTAPYNYTWSTGLTEPVGELIVSTAGQYGLTVSDAGGCLGSSSVTAGCSGTLSFDSATVTNETCYGSGDGSACVYVSGGTEPYTYFWQENTQTTQCVMQLVAGTYNVIVTDNNGCSVLAQPSIIPPAQLTASIVNTGDGIMPDTLTTMVTGGIPPYNYNWLFGEIMPEIAVSISGEYRVTVTDANGCLAFDTIIVGCSDTCVWPGDADYSGIADNNDLLAIGLGYGATGTARTDQSITWSAHQGTNWADYLGDTTNYKHIDCNGDGIINSDDTLAIIQNYYLQHPRSGGPDEVRGGIPALRIHMVPDTLVDGQIVTAHLDLGDVNSTADNVYGLAFTFNFDPLVVDTNEVYIAFNNNSWLCNNTTDHIDIDKKDASAGKLYTALSRIDHATRSGGGEIGSVSMKITTGNINGKDLAFYAMNTYITDLRVIDNQGNVLDVDAIADASTIEYEPTGINEIEWRGEVSLYPNPAQQHLTINSSQLPISNLQVSNLLGETVLQQQGLNTGKSVLNIATLSDGVYILKIASGSSTYHTKFMVTK